jgi:hypothetical protein
VPFEYVSVEEASRRRGLRMVVVGDVPSPWGEAAKGILHIKGIKWVGVRLLYDSELLKEWAGQRSAPVVVYENERPRSGWSEILLLAERLAPSPSLLPANPADRALVLGLAHERRRSAGRRIAGHVGRAAEGAAPNREPLLRRPLVDRHGCLQRDLRRIVQPAAPGAMPNGGRHKGRIHLAGCAYRHGTGPYFLRAPRYDVQGALGVAALALNHDGPSSPSAPCERTLCAASGGQFSPATAAPITDPRMSFIERPTVAGDKEILACSPPIAARTRCS